MGNTDTSAISSLYFTCTCVCFYEGRPIRIRVHRTWPGPKGGKRSGGPVRVRVRITSTNTSASTAQYDYEYAERDLGQRVEIAGAAQYEYEYEYEYKYEYEYEYARGVGFTGCYTRYAIGCFRRYTVQTILRRPLYYDVRHTYNVSGRSYNECCALFGFMGYTMLFWTLRCSMCPGKAVHVEYAERGERIVPGTPPVVLRILQ